MPAHVLRRRCRRNGGDACCIEMKPTDIAVRMCGSSLRGKLDNGLSAAFYASMVAVFLVTVAAIFYYSNAVSNISDIAILLSTVRTLLIKSLIAFFLIGFIYSLAKPYIVRKYTSNEAKYIETMRAFVHRNIDNLVGALEKLMAESMHVKEAKLVGVKISDLTDIALLDANLVMSDGKYTVESEFAAAVALWNGKVCLVSDRPELRMRSDLTCLIRPPSSA